MRLDPGLAPSGLPVKLWGTASVAWAGRAAISSTAESNVKAPRMATAASFGGRHLGPTSEMFKLPFVILFVFAECMLLSLYFMVLL
jgi:hypothetical protein